jgi:hypothetical protein
MFPKSDFCPFIIAKLCRNDETGQDGYAWRLYLSVFFILSLRQQKNNQLNWTAQSVIMINIDKDNTATAIWNTLLLHVICIALCASL